MITLLPFVPVAALLLLAPVLQDPAKEAMRQRIAAAVAATGLNHEKSPSGLSHVLTYDHDGGRRQRIYVASDAGTAGPRQTVTVYTTVWGSTEAPSSELLRKVFSSPKKFGSFYLFVDSKGVSSIRFSVQVDITALPEQPTKSDPCVVALRSMIEFVNIVGEQTDKELNGARDAG